MRGARMILLGTALLVTATQAGDGLRGAGDGVAFVPRELQR